MSVPRASEDLLRELSAQYASGMSVRALARVRGWSYGATHARLTAAQASGLVKLRSRGYSPAADKH